MDQLDLKIFRSLGVVPYGPESGDLSRLNPWVIARKVGANGNTVKLRLTKMRKSGFIRYFQIYPNFRLLGIEGTAYLFDLGDVGQKNEAIKGCALVDGVTEIHNFIGSQVCIDFAHRGEDDQRRKLELLRRLTRCESPERYYERVMPRVEVGLSSTDWRIIKALRYDAFKPLSKVAGELGLTAKTVRRRFERMAQGGALIVVPVVNPAHIANTITYTVLLDTSPERWNHVLKEAMEVFEGSYFLTRLHPPRNAAIHASASSLAEMEENFVRVKKIEGVNDARLLVLKEIREYTEWLDSEIEGRIESSGQEGARRGLASPGESCLGLPQKNYRNPVRTRQ